MRRRRLAWAPSGNPTGPHTPAERTFLAHAVKDCASYFPADITYAAAQTALDGVPGVGSVGSWVGPPRLTRMANSCKLHVARVWRFADEPALILATHRDTLRDRVDAALEALTEVNPWTVEVVPFSENLHGTLAWWQGGDASRTQTRDQYPEGGARFDPEENPTGPTSDATHPRPPLSVPTPTALGAGALTGLVVLMGGAAALWYLGARRSQEVRIRVDQGRVRRRGREAT